MYVCIITREETMKRDKTLFFVLVSLSSPKSNIGHYSNSLAASSKYDSMRDKRHDSMGS